MMLKTAISLAATLGLTFFVGITGVCARTLDGLSIPESVRLRVDGPELALRGAYVRRYFFFRTTAYAFYSQEQAQTFDQLIASTSPKRMVVTIMMSRFTADQFRRGWMEQFSESLSPEQLKTLDPQIQAFLDTFETLQQHEQLAFDFVPSEGVAISLRGTRKRVIQSDEFANALLSAWLGPRGVDHGLVQAVFGAK